MREIIKRGFWKPEEDEILKNYIQTHGEGHWATVSKRSGLMRGGKSCRLRWKNYLRPNIKRGEMSKEEEDLIIRMHKLLGNRWSLIAGRLPGRTDNEVKNYWNTHLNKKCFSGKRKATDSTNSQEAEKRGRFYNSPPPACNISQVSQEENELKKEDTNIDCVKYDEESPLLHLENSILASNNEPFPEIWDSFLLFQGLGGCSGEGTFGEFFHGF